MTLSFTIALEDALRLVIMTAVYKQSLSLSQADVDAIVTGLQSLQDPTEASISLAILNAAPDDLTAEQIRNLSAAIVPTFVRK